MSDDKDNKTEEPTGRRLDDARSKGQVAQSREVAHLIMVSAMLVVILMLGPLMTRDLALLLRRFVEQPHQMHIDGDTFQFMIVDMFGQLGTVLAVPLLLLLAAAFAPSLLQNGFLWTTASLTPKFERISPMAGIGRLFSLRNATQLRKGTVKMGIVGTIATVMMLPLFNLLEQYISTDVVMLLPALLSLSVKLLSGVIAILILVAGID